MVDGVVDQVADDRDNVSRHPHLRVGEFTDMGPEKHPALTGHSRLGQKGGDDQRIAASAGMVEIADRPFGHGMIIDDAQHVVQPAELDETGDGVQLVGVLVGLRSESLDQTLRRLEIADQTLQFRAITEGVDGAMLAASNRERRDRHQEHLTADGERHVDLVAGQLAHRQERSEIRSVLEAASEIGRPEPQHRRCHRVGQHHDAVFIHRQDPLVQRPEEAISVLVQRGDLRRLQPKCLAADVAGAEIGGDGASPERKAGGTQQPGPPLTE